MAPRGGGPGAGSRGRGGKFKKPTRGGGKHFSRDLRPLDADGNEIGMWGAGEKKESSDDDSSEEESSSEDEAGPSSAAQELSREERKKEKKARKDAAIARAKAAAIQVGDLPPSDSESDEDDDMPANPNHSKAARKQLQAPTEEEVEEATQSVSKMTVKAPQSRRERESLEAAQAKERYMKLHLAGKTEQAQSDMERLKAIREKREAERARKQAELEEKEDHDKVRRAEIEAKEAKKREAAMGKPPAKKSSKKSK